MENGETRDQVCVCVCVCKRFPALLKKWKSKGFDTSAENIVPFAKM